MVASAACFFIAPGSAQCRAAAALEITAPAASCKEFIYADLQTGTEQVKCVRKSGC